MNVFVIGPHRCGTSAVARMINLCGFYIGEPEELLPPTTDNETGYWEARWLVDFNDDLLFLFGSDWCTADRIAPHTLPAPMLQRLWRRAASWCASMEQHGNWVSTDPRLCLTAKFWLQVRQGALVVLCICHPREAVASMMHRTPCPFTSAAAALAAWRRYVLGAMVDTAGQPR
ncbi:MAG: hypothetical protein V3U27_14515, partial [Candidatus Tectomicrobia bacterium]